MTWSGEQVDLEAYFARIGHQGETAATVATLRALHRAHVASIPFENLDVALGREVPLDLKSLQDKLVRQRRGGYCYEQNSLLAAVLERLGFAVAARGARVRTRGPGLLPVTHALLVVEAGGEQWLVDAGFGAQGVREPVPLHEGVQVEQDGWGFGIERGDEGISVLRSLRQEGWTDLYAFAPQTLYPADFTMMNHYSSTHPLSKFVGQIVAQRYLPGERVVLVRDQLTIVRTDGSSDQRTVSVRDIPDILRSVFGIELSPEDSAELVRVYSTGV
ncbi:arylamine N-acetyltransferase family protein [Streptomyces beijiangensis]|uniref:Arylamine N-acetyltransferase n=1 Tax=Streptomyces beijiangensis TaxID=163361 RepID=A0A939FBC7_9ACTN|nr:arylamine N-acetyltransferase [Streptomyces beijiangensis]MBO0515482.1 arylamine N-acetyltransferase [Streptomyces beijiangensis]